MSLLVDGQLIFVVTSVLLIAQHVIVCVVDVDLFVFAPNSNNFADCAFPIPCFDLYSDDNQIRQVIE